MRSFTLLLGTVASPDLRSKERSSGLEKMLFSTNFTYQNSKINVNFYSKWKRKTVVNLKKIKSTLPGITTFRAFFIFSSRDNQLITNLLAGHVVLFGLQVQSTVHGYQAAALFQDMLRDFDLVFISHPRLTQIKRIIRKLQYIPYASTPTF